jgi:hypothetical protein
MPAPIAAAPAELAAVAEPAAPPPVALDKVVSQAGLEWVQTQARPAADAAPVEEAAQPRAGRVRKPRQAPAGESLQQVETRPDSPSA